MSDHFIEGDAIFAKEKLSLFILLQLHFQFTARSVGFRMDGIQNGTLGITIFQKLFSISSLISLMLSLVHISTIGMLKKRSMQHILRRVRTFTFRIRLSNQKKFTIQRTLISQYGSVIVSILQILDSVTRMFSAITAIIADSSLFPVTALIPGFSTTAQIVKIVFFQ